MGIYDCKANSSILRITKGVKLIIIFLREKSRYKLLITIDNIVCNPIDKLGHVDLSGI